MPMPVPPPVKLPLRRRPRLGERRGEREAMRGMMCVLYLWAICSVGISICVVFSFVEAQESKKDEAISTRETSRNDGCFPRRLFRHN